MILNKIKKFRSSPNRTVISFKKTDSISMFKRRDLNELCNGNHCGQAQCRSNKNEEEQDSILNSDIKSEHTHNCSSSKQGCECGCGASEGTDLSNCASSRMFGNITCSHSCNVLLCDLIAGAVLVKIVAKMILKCFK